MITKAQAGALKTAYIASMPDRVDASIRAAAASGVTSLTLSYLPASAGQTATFVTNVLQPAGWTVTQDDTNFTITIS